MQVLDYSTFLDSAAVRAFLPSEATPEEDIYECDEGIRFRWEQRHRVCWETVRLGEGAFLLASQDSATGVLNQRQVISGSDWVHIQFRLSGGGCENIDGTGSVQTPEGSCIVSRYPEDCVVERVVDATNGWKVACLFATPAALTYLLDLPAARLPECALWLAHEAHAEPRSMVLPLQSSMIFAVNDILSCPCRGGNRRAYMRGKSLDLFSTVIHALGSTGAIGAPALRLSAADMKRVALARSVMCAHLESRLTLNDLARKVGINRTKLAIGFRGAYGVSVQAFWRDARLDRARQLLRDGDMAVKEIAFNLGYSEISSFTRAFTRKFGISPRECRGKGRCVRNCY